MHLEIFFFESAFITHICICKHVREGRGPDWAKIYMIGM